MTTDFRALCADLLQEFASLYSEMSARVDFNETYTERVDKLLDRTSTALAQPEPQGPTDEELDELWAEIDGGGAIWAWQYFARAVLARWRNPIIHPEPVAPTDEEIEKWADAATEVPLEEMDPEVHGWRRCFTAKEFGETIRAAIACWGTPADTTSQEDYDG